MIVDTNISLGQWPFRSTPWNTTTAIVSRLKQSKVTQAWAGSCEALFDKDLEGVNRRLVHECQQFGDGILLPFGSVNPLFPDWPEDLRRCQETHNMRGIRLFPGYHGYKLSDPVVAQLLELAAKQKLIVQIVVQMEDARTQHPLMQVAPVDITPLSGLIAGCPELKVQVLNSSGVIPEQVLVPLARSGRVYFDFAMIEGTGGVARFADQAGTGAVLFGSHFPLFYLESSILKVIEGGFPEADAELLRSGNAQKLLATL
jgi:predicted TIM-barrel fold metal-dependent hydrolase